MAMTTKLWILAILASVAAILGTGVLTLQVYIIQEQQLQNLLTKRDGGNRGQSASSSSSSSSAASDPSGAFAYAHSRAYSTEDPRFIRSSLKKQDWFGDDGASSPRGIGKVFWNRARAFLLHWDAVEGRRLDEDEEKVDEHAHREDPMFVPSMEDFFDPETGKGASPALAAYFLKKAADAGHATAQHYAAMAYASGIWPVSTTPYGDNGIDSENDEIAAFIPKLHVTEDFVDTLTTSSRYNDDDNSNQKTDGDDSDSDSHSNQDEDEQTKAPRQSGNQKREPVSQLVQAYMYWHMAAIGGNIEAAMALAHRIDMIHPQFESGDSSRGSTDSTCMEALPYYEAAANGIVDQLEQSPNSRGKTVPPQDQHTLAEIHMHGGQSSMLEWHNKPSESKEAIQYYHIRATMGVDHTAWANGGSGSEVAKIMTKKIKAPATTTSMTQVQPDVNAAYTLAQLYHAGARGVPQNLTRALYYYEIASEFGNSWESHGNAGMMYFWGLGMDHHYRYTAWEYFEMGAPAGLESCRRRYERSLRHTRQQQKGGSGGDGDGADDDDPIAENGETAQISTCDTRSVNGLGLVYWYGIPGELEPDLVEAEKYFTLAKEMGSIEAHYNLAMLWLGFKSHFKSVDDLPADGQSSTDNLDHPFQEGAGSEKGSKDDHSGFALHKSKVPGKEVFKGPTQKEYSDAVKLLTVAANKDHLLARHRIALIYANGIKVRGNDGLIEFDVVKPDCRRAKTNFQWIIDRASLDRSKRLRNAYNHYMNGNMEASLRNYLAAAETGSSVAKSNAAFLLERGTCLGLSKHDCAKASVRLWKAAATLGSAEACLRVGDFYYYGLMRTNAQGKDSAFGHRRAVGPFGWLQYIIFAEQYLPQFVMSLQHSLYLLFRKLSGKPKPVKAPKPAKDYSLDDADTQDMIESDLAMAAHYYALASEKYDSSRANFNLGFMHEWGLGIAQDFPLAKRHYDLAGNRAAEGAGLAISIALSALGVHEKIVKLEMSLIDWLDRKLEETLDSSSSPASSSSMTSTAMDIIENDEFFDERRPTDIIFSHIFRFDSLLIGVLIYILFQVATLRRKRQRS